MFELVHQSTKSAARVGRIHTPHGIIETPNFVPVATNAAIKAVDAHTLAEVGIQLMFCNTYHLLVHPGADVVQAAGGLHTFMQRNAPIITDSGGFQVFSLAYGSVHSELKSKGTKKHDGCVLKISEEGALFRSYRDGTPIMLTPESSVQAQKALGADIIIPLDELPPYHIGPQALLQSFNRTHRWQERSLIEHKANTANQIMYAVVHGGTDPALRAQSCAILRKLPFDGFSIGGSLGKTRDEMAQVVAATTPHLPAPFPRHLLGIGDLPSIQACIPFGIDTFDSSYPTKCARHGILLTAQGPLNITSSRWKHVHEPVSTAPLCRHYSAAYLHHLFKAHELAAYTLATIHNLDYMMQLMNDYREKILQNQI
jgi:queuine tRNA-ribosyltransferase